MVLNSLILGNRVGDGIGVQSFSDRLFDARPLEGPRYFLGTQVSKFSTQGDGVLITESFIRPGRHRASPQLCTTLWGTSGLRLVAWSRVET